MKTKAMKAFYLGSVLAGLFAVNVAHADVLSDSATTTAVKAALASTKFEGTTNFSITTVNGVVLASGCAVRQNDLNHALDVIKGTNGVKEVVNKISRTDNC